MNSNDRVQILNKIVNVLLSPNSLWKDIDPSLHSTATGKISRAD